MGMANSHQRRQYGINEVTMTWQVLVPAHFQGSKFWPGVGGTYIKWWLNKILVKMMVNWPIFVSWHNRSLLNTINGKLTMCLAKISVSKSVPKSMSWSEVEQEFWWATSTSMCGGCPQSWDLRLYCYVDLWTSCMCLCLPTAQTHSLVIQNT